MEITVVTNYNEIIECRSFTDVDPDISGVELSRSGNRLGSMINVSIPDENDIDAMAHFKEEVEEWIIDNEY